MTTVLAFRSRLYPNKKQEEHMSDAIETCRRLWNIALADRKEAWEYMRLSTTYEEQCLMLTAEKRVDASLAAVYSQSLEDVLRRLDRAFEAFFERRARYPKFKRYRESGSFTYPQAYNGSVKPDRIRKRLFLSKVGNVRAVFHREMPPGERLKTCTVVRERNGEWYASLVYEYDVQTPEPVTAFISPVGIDLGLESLIATTDGAKVPHPQFLRKAEGRLRHAQRQLSMKAKGSSNRKKARRLLAVQHSHVSRQRADINHKLSAELVKKHDLIAFEDLKVKNMVRNHSLAKSITDAGWGQLRRFSEYKAKRTGKIVVRVPPAYSTQECFFCGALNQVTLSVRVFDCRGCSRRLDRDFNAAWIVLKRGLAQVGQDMPELKPAETGPLPVPTTGRASLVGDSGTKRHKIGAGSPRPSVVGGCHTMVERQSAKKGQKSKGLTKGEIDAMRETLQERKAGKANDESAVLAKIAEMREPDRTMAKKLHTLIKATAPALSPRTWYGMPAYAMDDKVVCFFQSAQKFKSRYSTLGFSDKAKLDGGQMWPVGFALKGLGAAEEERIAELVKKAIS